MRQGESTLWTTALEGPEIKRVLYISLQYLRGYTISTLDAVWAKRMLSSGSCAQTLSIDCPLNTTVLV
jgi:hypothetical protein